MKKRFNVALYCLFATFALFNTIRVFAGGQTWHISPELIHESSSTENSYSYVTYGNEQGGSVIYWGTSTIDKPVILQMEGQEDVMCNKQIRGLYISPDTRGNRGRPIDQTTLDNYIGRGFSGYDQLSIIGGFFTNCTSSDNTFDSKSVFGYIGYEMNEGEDTQQGPKIWAGITGMEADPISLSRAEDLKFYGLGGGADVVATGFIFEAERGRGDAEARSGINIGDGLSGVVSLIETDIFTEEGCPQNGCTTKTELSYFVNVNKFANLNITGNGIKHTINKYDIQPGGITVNDPMIELTEGDGIKEFYYNLYTGSESTTGTIIVELRGSMIPNSSTGVCEWGNRSLNPIYSGGNSMIYFLCNNFAGFTENNFSIDDPTFGDIIDFTGHTDNQITKYLIGVKATKGNGSIRIKIDNIPDNVIASGNSPILNINPDQINPPTCDILYNPSTPTNGNVIATLTNCTEPITVTNNGGNSGYVFTQNGSFTFKFSNNIGLTGEATATVTWIDKQSPACNISYNPTSSNWQYGQNVVATLTNCTEPITVTNNGGNSGYVFSQNGSFTFEFRDNAGNIGTSTATVDRILDTPIITSGCSVDYSPNIGDLTYGLTSGSVVATLTGGCIGQITVTSNGGYTHTFTQNGSFTFEYKYNATGMTGAIMAEVSWIDKTIPTCNVLYNPSTPTNGNVIVSLISCSEAIQNPGQTWTFGNNGSETLVFRDLAGNVGSVTANVNWIDRNPPICNISYNPSTPTNGNVVANLNCNEQINGETTHIFTENGSHTFNVTDYAGNSSSITANVNWISTAPIQPIIVTGLIYFQDNVYSSRTQSDIIIVGGPAPVKKWKFNSNNNCDLNINNYMTVPSNGQININDELHNGQYICLLGQNGSNVQTIASDYPIKIDRTNPNLELRQTTINGNSLVFSRSGNDTPSGISGYNLNIAHRSTNGVITSNAYGPFTASVSSYTVNNFVDGDYRWSVIAEDIAGNRKVVNGSDFTITSGVIGGHASQIKFNTINNADINEYYKSSTGIVSGLANNATAIASLSGGALFINGRFVGSTGQVKNNDSINIEMKSSSQYDTAVTGVLSINSVLSTFTIHTKQGINFQNLTGMTPMQKIQGILFVDNLVEMYKADQKKLARFLSTFLQVLQDQSDLYAKKLRDADSEAEKREYTIYKQSVDFLYLIVKDRLNNLSFKDYRVYIAPNGRQYIVDYDEYRFAYTSPDFTKVKYFPTWESFKNHIDINNPKKGNEGIAGNIITAPNGKRYTIYQKNGKRTSDGFLWPKYFDTKDDIINHIFASNPPSDWDHRIDPDFKKVRYKAPNGKLYVIFKTSDEGKHPNLYSSYNFINAKYFTSLEAAKKFIWEHNR